MLKWKKIGKIFDPLEHKLSNNCVAFAQSPQALVFDDFVRIYFSTREKDSDGKFLSHISFVDMSKDFTRIIGVSKETVIELGKLGTFDEHGIFPINPLRHNGKILAFTCGWSRRVSVSVETSTGLAISDDDGLTFRKIGDGPVMSSSLHEPFLVGDAFVKVINNTFHMWYIYGSRWIDHPDDDTPARVYKIARAVSPDGITWNRDSKQIIADRLDADECQALPTVEYFDGRYHMFFCYRYATGFRTNKERGYRIGYAWSENLVDWKRDDASSGIEVTPGSWDSDMMCYPHVITVNGDVYLLYNGNQFGRHGFGAAVLER